MPEVDPSFPIEVRDLIVEYGRGHRKVRAVDGLTFRVAPGECVGFVGPNGAGKSTTIKAIMGFLFPQGGAARVFGRPAGTVESRRRTGYLPEVALYYPYMKARELLELYGGLHGMGRQALKRCIPDLLEEVGLGGLGERLLKTFSKGMQQRLGIAQAIIADPDLLVFDELSSGLDPVGRFDLRQVLLRLKHRGRSIFFSSHELAEVEDLCDRVLIVHRGRLVEEAAVDELLRPLNRFRISFALPAGVAAPCVANGGEIVERAEGRYECTAAGVGAYAETLQRLAEGGAEILDAQSEHVSLEQHFMDLIRRGEELAPAGAGENG